MSSFTFISYSGDDAGRVLAKILEENDSSSSENSDEHDLSAKTKIAIGFQPIVSGLGATQTAIANAYGVSQSHVSNLLAYKSRKDA